MSRTLSDRIVRLTVLLLGVTTPCVYAEETAKLVALDGAAGDQFGSDIAVAGSRVVVGAWEDDDQGSGSGAVFVFDAATGQQLHKLLPDDGATGNLFGCAVAASGDLAVVGALFGDHNGSQTGAAYVFDLNSGAQLVKLTASDGVFNDRFGKSVDIDGDIVIVGAHWEDDGGFFDSGAAYLFDAATGQELAKLVATDAASEDAFGAAVAVRGGTAVVGATGDDENGSHSGSAYLFDVATGQQLAKLLPADGILAAHFGQSVDLDDDLILVGSSFGAENQERGGAYLFDAVTGQQVAKLLSIGGTPYSGFGSTVAIDGPRILVGSPLDDEAAKNAGAAYLFELPSRQLISKLLPSDGELEDGFGRRVALDGGVAIGAAVGDDDQGDLAGAVYVFDGDLGLGTSYCGPANTNSSGGPGVLAVFGSAAVAENEVLLTAHGLPANQFGYFLTSQDQGFVANPGGSQGNLCLGGTIGRYRKDVSTSGEAGRFALAIDLTDMPPPAQSQVLAGETWNFQAWFRDKNPTATSNFTDGVSILFE